MGHTNEQLPVESDGARWLRMLDREDIIGTSFTLKDGKVISAEDFTEACPEDACNMLYAMEQLGPEHPLYQQNLPMAKHILETYFGARLPQN